MTDFDWMKERDALCGRQDNADALEEKDRRIAELRKEADMMHSEYKTARARIAELTAALMRIGQPGKQIVYCRDGHEEAVLLARAAYRGEKE